MQFKQFKVSSRVALSKSQTLNKTQDEEQILSLEDYQITKHFKEIQMAEKAKLKDPFFPTFF